MGMPPAPTLQPLPTEAIVALQRGNKIEAIKVVRKAHGLDLKDSKDLVEAHLAADASLQQAFSAARPQGGGRGLLLWIAIGLAAGWLLFLFLKRG
jgi:hypothetical protein